MINRNIGKEQNNLYEPKFYINEGHRCAQTAIKSVITGNIFSLKELDELTGRKGREITAPIQIAYCLKKLKINFVYPVKPLFLEGDFEKIKRETLKQFGQEIFNKLNFKFIRESRNNLIASSSYSLQNNFNFNRICNLIAEGKIPLCLINYDIYVDREDKKSGHYLLINNFDKEFVWVMDSGPRNSDPNRRILRKRLEKSLMQTPIDYGTIFISNHN